jgi:hypothetical protein
MANLLMTDPWQPQPPPEDVTPLKEIDPRVDTTHQVGDLPCPSNPPPPVGWVYWTGPVPPAPGKLAVEMLHDPAQYPMGCFVQALLDGQLVGARVEWHDLQGATGKKGCFRGVNLMKPHLIPSSVQGTVV